MPSSTTTNVTIGTLLDLIGSVAPSPSVGKDQPAFDSLLQLPPAPPLPPSPPPVSDEQPLHPREESPSRTGSQSASPAATDSANPAPNDPPQPQQENGAKTTTSSPAATAKPEEEPAHDQQQQPEADSVVAESLAGIAGVATVAKPVVATGETTDTNESEPTGVKAAATPKTNVSATTTVNPSQVAAANATAADAQSQKPQAVADSANAAGSTAVKNQIASQTAKTTTADASATQNATKDPAATSLDGQVSPVDGNPQTPDPSQNAQPVHDPQHPAEPKTDSQPIKLDPDILPAPTADAASTAAASPPPAAPVAASLPTLEPAQPANTSAATNSLTAATPSQRLRLPAEVLSQPGGEPARRSTVEIDTSRLLTRVARAFSAAQERDGGIHLRLSPPELGSLRLDVRVQDGALIAHLQTETDAARNAILDNLPALRERLAEQGVRIERFDVDLMQRQPGGMPDQSGGRQQDSPLPQIQAASLPPPRVESINASLPSPANTESATGLNVII